MDFKDLARLRIEADGKAAAERAVEPEVRGPGDALTQDEETCLLILAQGASMAPIGRWEKTLASLAQRGLSKRLDASNYVVTERGRAVADKSDDAFVRGWIKDSNAAVARRNETNPITQANDLFRAIDRPDGSTDIEPVTLAGLSAPQIRALARFYEENTGRKASEICQP